MEPEPQLALNALRDWIAPVLALLGVIAAGWIGVLGARRTAREERTNPAYAELLKSDEQTRTRLDKLEQALDAERTIRRGLEDRVDHLEDSQHIDRAYIRRVIRDVLGHDPTLARFMRPFPEWHTDPDGPRLSG